LAVPCVGMLPPHWIVAPLLSGLAAVTVAPCSCGVEDDVAERVAGVVEFARAWVEASMLSGRIVAFDAATSDDLFGPTTALNPFGPAGALNPFGALGAADVARALGVPGPLGLPASPLGLVTLDQSTCTGCEMCAVSCPTGALQVLRTGESVEIGFNAAMCTGCGTCLTRCPEVARGAITLGRRVDLDAIESGTRVLVRHTVRSCSRCGRAIATDAVLRRIEEALGDDAVLGSIVDLCLECRGARIAL